MSEQDFISEEAVLRALQSVGAPQIGGDIVQRGLVREVKICDGHIAFELLLPAPIANFQAALEQGCREALSHVEGVRSVNVRTRILSSGPAPSGPAQGPAGPSPAAPGPQAGSNLLPGVRHVIAVGSGKGGVGKSTVAVNLATALALDGHRVGLLDADVYGPSIPMMMGLRQTPHTVDGKLVPLERHGVQLMSLGFLMPDDSAHVIWRGPMVGSAVRQMITDCHWGELDYLVVDLPPGTGDAQLTLAQTVPLTGAVVVMTSQDVAVNIASKAVGMFQRLNVPILGVVGNMDFFACPSCGTHTPIFTRGGSETASEKLGVPFLGSIPLEPATVEHGDRGVPTVIAAPDSSPAQAFREVARNVASQVNALDAAQATTPGLGGLLGRFKKD